MKTKQNSEIQVTKLNDSEMKVINGGSLTEDIWYAIGAICGALSQAGASPQERANYYM